MAIIYKITNKVNNKIYIGETIRGINKRWNEHISQSLNKGHGYNYHLHAAIRKYGVNNFDVEIIDECNDEDRFILETKYIIQYDSTNPQKGYNYILEGEGTSIYSSNKILEYWNLGYTCKEIANELGCDRSVIYKRLEALGISHEEKMKRQGQKTSERCSKIVLQYTLDGKFIQEWASATECQRSGYSQAMISNVCRQEQITAHGYLWKYKEDNQDIKEWINRLNNKKQSGKPKKRTIQLDENRNIIHIYDSAADAAQTLGLKDKSNICAACRKNRKAYGFYWLYENEGGDIHDESVSG